MGPVDNISENAAKYVHMIVNVICQFSMMLSGVILRTGAQIQWAKAILYVSVWQRSVSFTSDADITISYTILRFPKNMFTACPVDFK